MRKQTRNDIKKALPDLESEKVDVLSDELDRVLAIKTVLKSDGGKELINVLRANCFITLRKLIIESRDKPSLESLLGLIAAYAANMDLLSELQDVSMEEELRAQLDEAVKEAHIG